MIYMSILFIMQILSPDNRNLCDGMNFPRGGPPVFGITGSDVLGILSMPHIEIQPAFKLDPAPDQLRSQRLF